MTPERRPENIAREIAFEAELAAERAQFGLAERAAGFGYWRQRLTDGHTSWSPGMYRLLNIDESQKPDMAWLLSQIDDEDAADIRQIITNAIKTRSPFYYRSRPKDRSNPALYVDTHGEVDVGPDGRVITLVGVCHDVTKQVIAEAARAAAEDRYRLMAEEASDIIMLYDAEGCILFASNALQNILGRTPAEIETGHFLELIHPEDLSQAKALREKLQPGEVRAATYRLLHRKGHYIWIESNVRGVFDEGSCDPKNIISVSRDVSERKTDEMKMKAAQQEAEAASRAKSAFLASMSHELRTPLNAIIGFSEMLTNDELVLQPARRLEYAKLINESGHHLLSVVNGILDMSKMETGNFEITPEPFAPAQAIVSCCDLLALKARDAQVEIKTRMTSDLPEIVGDRRAFSQILINLISNAVKFTPRDGRVTVSAQCEGAKLALVVEDTGVGIGEDDLPRIGEAFFQARASYDRRHDGTGLGLSIVKGLVRLHDGEVDIASRLGKGTRVTVRLPLDCEGEHRAADPIKLVTERAHELAAAANSDVHAQVKKSA